MAKTLCFSWFRLYSGIFLSMAASGALGAASRFNLSVGPASPSPGLGMQLAVIGESRERHGDGFLVSQTSVESDSSGSRQNTRAYDVFHEGSLPFLDGFHFFRWRVLAGAALFSESLSASERLESGKSRDRKLWAPHIGCEAALDYPVADLMWIRGAVWTGKALASGAKTQGGISAGVVVGGPWFGIGD